jgi:hypothetical protein
VEERNKYGISAPFCVRVLGMKLVLWRPPGAWNFEGTPRFLENVCTPAVNLRNFPVSCQTHDSYDFFF